MQSGWKSKTFLLLVENQMTVKMRENKKSIYNK